MEQIGSIPVLHQQNDCIHVERGKQKQRMEHYTQYRNNNFPYNKTHHKLNDYTTKKKWVTFTYYSPQIRKITIQTHRSKNSIQKLQQYMATHQTQEQQQNRILQTQWNLRTNVQNM
jgi:hypothetical protein